MSWESLGDWWIDELASDPAYEEEIGPHLIELLEPKSGLLYLDVGCGEGRMMDQVATVGARVIGCDLNRDLLRRASSRRPVVRLLLPDLGCLRKRVFDGAYLGLVLEHLADEGALFRHVARVIRRGGSLAVMINHPIWTAPHSSPIEQEDGEILWRPGSYFGRGYSDEPAGDQKVRFYHRPLSALLNAASDSGWDLRRVIESGISPTQVARYPQYAGQEQIPRLLGLRWRRR